MHRGLFTSDFIAALTIFLVVFLIISPMWGSLNIQVASLEQTRRIQMTALSATDTLIRTKGSPSNWNESNVRSIGLAEEERILSANKTKSFFLFLASNYTDAKFMLGAGAYQMTAEVQDKSGSAIVYDGVTFSRGPVAANALEVANVERIAIMKFNETGREFVNLKLVIWR